MEKIYHKILLIITKIIIPEKIEKIKHKGKEEHKEDTKGFLKSFFRYLNIGH